ncbi:helicase C-terminal domain-containing protein [Bosea sp. ANAM02]|uniref:ATP-dependent DNA helicase n=1 Tax=Bosea sp. ANAM02 TaxID=2020412 RepID=UPI00156560C5|nr:helicase C-terminal domain-containing protein [Bosea sp. ANAM02]
MSIVHDLFSNPESEFFSIGLGGRLGKPRAAQAQFAEAVEGLLDQRSGIGIIQGETGSGKTAGYLVPALLKAAKTGALVVISTNTLNLQKQLMKDALPSALVLIERLTGKRLRAARRIGRQNFISLPGLQIKINDLAREATPNSALVKLLGRIHAELSIDPANATKQHVSEAFGQELGEIGVPAHFFDQLQIGRVDGDDYAYLKMLDDSVNCDVLVTNHALLTYNLMCSGGFLYDVKSDDRRPVIMIVDEADALASMAASLATRKLPLRDLDYAASRIDVAKATRTRLNKCLKNIAASFDQARDAGAILNRPSDIAIMPLSGQSNLQKVLLGEIEEVEGILTTCMSKDGLGTMRRYDLDTIVRDLQAIRANLARQGGASSEILSLYWSPIRNFPGFHIDGGDAGRIISRLWRLEHLRPATLLFTSATLTGAADRGIPMAGFAREIGMGQRVLAETVCAAFAPEQFGSMDFVLIDPRIAPPVTIRNDGDDDDTNTIANPAILPWWCGMIRAASDKGGRILVLLPSHRDASLVRDALGAIDGRRILLDSRDEGAQVLRAFETDASAILISAIRWEGLDMPGKIRHIVIPRYPLTPRDVVRDALREESLLARGYKKSSIRAQAFMASLSQARRKFFQGAGRGIRIESDSVTIWIGDSRWPLSDDRRERHPEVISRNWASSMVYAVPQRFRSNLDNAAIYSLASGVGPFESIEKERRQSRLSAFLDKIRPRREDVPDALPRL